MTGNTVMEAYGYAVICDYTDCITARSFYYSKTGPAFSASSI